MDTPPTPIQLIQALIACLGTLGLFVYISAIPDDDDKNDQ